MSKLSHSHQPTMDMLDFWRTYRDGALRPMETAPRDGDKIFAAFPDDQAPNQEKCRRLCIAWNPRREAWCVVGGQFDGDHFDDADFEGWVRT